MSERYVVVAVARARQPWCSEIARWATGGAAPIELLKCLSPAEALVILGSGRRVSALLVDARSTTVDRDLVDSYATAGAPTVVVSDGSVHRDWESLGCAAVVDAALDLPQLLDVLDRHATAVDRDDRRPGRLAPGGPESRRGRLVAVVGTGGSGGTTLAMGLASNLVAHPDGPDPRADRIVLVDGARRSDMAAYHDIGDVVPGLPELVEAHRSDRLTPGEVRRLTHRCPTGYDLLLGMRRPGDWVTMRRRSVDAALEALGRTYATVVLDVDRDTDGVAGTGSDDVEDRHAITLSALATADVVVVVGRPGLKGVHDTVRLLDDLDGLGVPGERLVPVVNDAPRSPASRAAAARTLAQLRRGATTGPVVFQRRLRRLDDHVARTGSVPAATARQLAAAVADVFTRHGRRQPVGEGERVRRGDLGTDLDLAGSDVA